MFFSRLAVPAVLAAVASVVRADAISTEGLTILVPGGDSLWWVAASINTLAWTCKTTTLTNFTVLIGNTDTTVLATPQAIIAQENNFDCSRTIDASILSQAAATNYFIQLADPFNSTNIYAQSANFEIKALGSTYPPASATPSGVPGAAAASSSGSSNSTASSTGSGSGSASATGSATSSSASTTQSTSAGARSAGVPALVAVAAAAFGIVLA